MLVGLVRSQEKSASHFDLIFTVLFLILVMGTPLVFTSLTRSVFEVNKLLLLRSVIVITWGVWLLRSLLYKDNNIDDTEGYSLFKWRGFHWKKTGLEIPILAWLGANIISTAFSQNIYIGIIGSYDRWEGIITIFNYMMLVLMTVKLVHKRFQIPVILFGFLASTGFSAIYGIFQSLGYDFMNWSQDPTYRVFACINNPVHFCAYVGMMVPVGLATLFYLQRRFPEKNETPDKPVAIKNLYLGALLLCIFCVKLWTFPAFDLGFLQMVLLIAASWVIAEMTRESIPRMRSFAFISGYTILLIGSAMIDLVSFNGFQWLGLTLSTCLFFVLAPAPNWNMCLKRLVLIITVMIFYTQLLSFSRATWVGFMLVMPIFFLFLNNRFVKSTAKKYYLDVIVTFLTTGIFTLIYIFKIHTYSPAVGFSAGLLVLAGLHYLFYSIRSEYVDPKSDTTVVRNLTLIFASLLCLFSFSFVFPEFADVPRVFYYGFALAYLWLVTRLNDYSKAFMERVSLIMFFSHIQVTGSMWLEVFIQIVFALSYYITGLKGSSAFSKEKKAWLMAAMMGMSFVILIPSFPGLFKETISFITVAPVFMILLTVLGIFAIILYFLSLVIPKDQLIKDRQGQLFLMVVFAFILGSTLVIKDRVSTISNEGSMIALKNIQKRSQEYEGELKSSARISMWKSALPWFKDYPIIGSGPDTIKYMYPEYRRPDYGILEGGHNYTPDRLHNEYLNTLVTRGFLGFAIYYFGIIGGWLFLVLRWLKQNEHNPYRFLVAGFMTGASVYLGQVLFNFGVVATLVLFYILMSLSLAITIHPEFQNNDKED
jgi:O-antigen ligase